MIEVKLKRGGRPSKRPTNEELANLYANFTAKEIGCMYEVPVATVRNWISKARKELNFNNNGGRNDN